MSHKLVSLYIGDGEYYTRIDADAVIAELQEKLKVQTSIAEEGWKEFRTYHTSYAEAVKELYDKNKELRYQKFKRCLAMANWCCDACDKWMMRKAKAIVLGKDGVKEYYQAKRKLFLFMRWQTRWLKIAEQFKDKEATK